MKEARLTQNKDGSYTAHIGTLAPGESAVVSLPRELARKEKGMTKRGIVGLLVFLGLLLVLGSLIQHWINAVTQ